MLLSNYTLKYLSKRIKHLESFVSLDKYTCSENKSGSIFNQWLFLAWLEVIIIYHFLDFEITPFYSKNTEYFLKPLHEVKSI